MVQVKRLISTILILTLLVATTSLPAQDKIIDQIVAVVGGNIVLKSDIEKMYIDQMAQGVTSDGDMKCEILEKYLIDKLLIAEAELDTLIQVSDSQVNQQMEAQLQMYVAHFGTEKAVENFFKKPMADIKSEMRSVVKDNLMSSSMRDKIVKEIKATPSEVRQFYRNLKDDDIPLMPVHYEYAQIVMRPEISLEEENEVKAELRSLKHRIEEGASFAAMAIMYSEGPSASNGGEIGYLGRAQLDPAYASAAFNLKDGAISNVVKSDFGYHLIQRLGRQGDRINTRHILKIPKFSDEALNETKNRLDSIADAVRKERITFSDAAAYFSTDKNTRNNGGLAINPYDLSSKFTLEELDGSISKTLSNLKIGEISDPFETIDKESRQTYYQIIKLVNRVEAHKADLQNDYQFLSDMFLAHKQQEALEKWVAEKQSQTYIRIDKTYANCNFEFKNWIK